MSVTNALIPISEIQIGDRVRKDMGDIRALADSIAAHGLLHPVVVTPDRTLVVGARRIEAARLLGWKEIPVREMDIEDLLLAERDENSVRKDFLPTEAVAIGKLIEERFRPNRTDAVKRAWATRRAKKNGTVKLTGPSTPTVRDVAAKAVGLSAGTYQHAKEVVRAAEENPEAFGDLPTQMDSLGVYPAHREMKSRQNGKRPSSVIPRTRTVKSRKSIAQRARHAIGVIVSISSEFETFTADAVKPTPEESKSWERELADVVSSLNRFRREIRQRRTR